MEIIERELGMKCLPLTVRSGQRLRKAVILRRVSELDFSSLEGNQKGAVPGD